ncbi:SLOG family protein [Viridibacillus sp. NPDC093762]|uniref:SLOG family protein n=1 Tax=Viridibacillus sp. NPDC093762 TaxID=3390720 RepID=UPI003D03A721
MLKRLVITGYKAHELGIFNDQHPGIPIIKKALHNQLISLINDGLEWVILSGQLGVEIWAAEVVQELQIEYPDVKYAIITPFLDQQKNWNEQKQEKYDMIAAKANFVTSLTKRSYEAPWQFIEKNKFLIKNSDGILIIYDEENDGSPKYIKKLAELYAEKHDYTILNINAYDLQVVAEEEQMKEWE